MKSLIETCIAHNKATLLSLIIIFIMGISAYISAPKELSPDVKIPIISISTSLQGISPQDADRLLVKPIENAVSSVEGVKEMRSTAVDNRAYTILVFNAGFDTKKALEDVRAKVDEITSDLPQDATRPRAEEINLSLFPVLNVALVGELPERQLFTIARELKKRIEQVRNVLSVEIAGMRDEVVDVIVEPRVMDGYNLHVSEILQAIDSNSKLVAAGKLENGYSVKVNGVLQTIEDIMEVPIKVDGISTLKIKDVAEIRPTFEDVEGFARINGKSAIVLEVAKRSGENLIETVEKIKETVKEVEPFLPSNLSIVYSLDQSETVIDVLRDLQNNVLIAVLLVGVIIFTFMGGRAAILVALAIPGSFYIGIIILSYFDMTMNIVVLFSLIMSVGMLVDASIVVNEYADRKMIVGTNKEEAYRISALHMAWPVLASTMTTIIVFMPLLFWPGIVGEFMKYLPLTLIFTLTGSLLMSLVFTPVLGGMFGSPSTLDPIKISYMQAIEDGEVKTLSPFLQKYYNMLCKVLDYPGKFVMVILGTLVGSIIIYMLFGRGLEFFSNVEPDVAILTVRSQGNFSAQERDKLLQDVEEKIINHTDEVKIFYSRSGTFNSDKFSSDDVIGLIQMEFVDWKKRRKATEIISDIQTKVGHQGGLIIELQEQEQGPKSGNKPIKVNVSSYFFELIDPSVDKIIDWMKKVGGFNKIEDNRSSPEIEWVIEVDRNKAAMHGVNTALLGEYIKMVTNGAKIGSYHPDNSDEEVDIFVRLPEKDRSISRLNTLFVNGASGPTPMSNFITVKPQQKIKKLNREDSLPVISITADVDNGLLVSDQLKKLKKEMISHQNELDKRVNVKFKGEIEDQQEAQSFLSKAFCLSLLGVILILVIQFNSYYYVFIIMTAVFLSTVGVIIGLLITGQSFVVVMCGVGIISLAGIVVNNNILLIDAFQFYLKSGCQYKDAIIRSAISRVKPILLTAGTTILGLLPMITRINIDFIGRSITYDAPSSQWWVHLSTTVAGGLFFATILTLFFTPALLMLGQKNK